jgi:transposase
MTESTQVRTLEPQRSGQTIAWILSEDSLPFSHPARIFWEVFGTVNLSPFTTSTTSTVGHAGRPELSPRVKLTLWAYSIYLGINSAREIERRIEFDFVFRWIVADLKIGHTTLSDFLTQHITAFKSIFIEILGRLIHEGVLSLDLVAQDGSRVLASASHNSFRKELALQVCLEQAELHLKAVLRGEDDPDPTPRRHAARRQAAYSFKIRIKKAIEVIKELRLKKQVSRDPHRRKKIPRASSTDPDSRLMKMSEGNIAPAYNIQLATAGSLMGGPITIIGIMISQSGTDKGRLIPMCKEIQKNTGILPKVLMADADHVTYEEIREAHGKVELLLPIPERAGGEHGASDEAIKEWKARMETDKAIQQYRSRKAIAERANSNLLIRFGLEPLPVRGVVKVNCVVLMGAIVNNVIEHKEKWQAYFEKKRLAA